MRTSHLFCSAPFFILCVQFFNVVLATPACIELLEYICFNLYDGRRLWVVCRQHIADGRVYSVSVTLVDASVRRRLPASAPSSSQFTIGKPLEQK